MGLSIHPGGAAWSYGGFMRFRERLATEEGINLREMRGYFTDDFETFGTTSWSEVVSALVPILDHSDCDGYIDSYECEQMIPRLCVIGQKWEDDILRDVGNYGLRYDYEQLCKLITGLKHCAEHGCALSFG